MNLSEWQHDNIEKFSNLKINKIIVPGTHDSCAYQLIPKYEKSIWKKIGSRVDIAKRWTLCQDKTIYDQLMIGVRHFDIRLTKENDIYYVSHTFICDTLSSILEQFNEFITMFKDEFIFVSLDKDANGNFDEVDMKNVGRLIKDRFENRCIMSNYIPNDNNDTERIKFIKYKDLLKSSARLIIYNKIEPSFVNPWTHIVDCNEKVDYLNNEYSKFMEKNYNILSFTLTPKADTILSSICPCSSIKDIKTLSECINNKFENFINEERKNVSCYTFDYIDENLSRSVIELNL